MGLGYAIATGVCFGLSAYLNHAQMVAFGWRIAFVLGSLLALLAMYLRRRLYETPVFMQKKQGQHLSLLAAIGRYKWALLKAIGLVLLPAAIVALDISFPLLLRARYHFAMGAIYHALFLAALMTAVLIPLFAWLGDGIGRRRLYIGGCGLLLLGLPYLWHALALKTTLALYAFIFFYHLIEAILPAAYFVMLAECFPTSLRTTFYALAYNLVYALMAFLPTLVALALAHHWPQWDFLLLLLLLTGISVATCASFAAENPLDWQECSAEASTS